jgi:hypothetical protein
MKHPPSMSPPQSIAQQITRNFVAILSLVVALLALTYNTWRNERTEQNRSTRVASFEMLKTLGEPQVIVDQAHFGKDKHDSDLTQGLGKILFIRDLAQVIPAPAPEDAEKLLAGWREQGESLAADNAALQRISEDIYQARRDVLEILHGLR